ncbi:interferon-gamma-inducible GTPase 10-like, partial [Heptranchias perlo]|uniref:interferon-gamma-inducible GTPase 10-like n=1 Tax=Heptranchias perlo TaxID=212740 RepID=UPI00355A3560
MEAAIVSIADIAALTCAPNPLAMEVLSSILSAIVEADRGTFSSASQRLTMADVGEEDKLSSQSDRGGLEADVQEIQSYFEKSRSVNLHIAVIGESGTGKSTFINGLLGIGDGDDGKTETTLEPIMWNHPNKDTVKICELPGTGDRKFLASVYLDRVKFDQYDFFIILNNTHFKQNDVYLAKEIHQRKKKCYFVRSKIDQELESVKGREKSKYNEGETLDRLRNDCVESLRKEGIKSPQVFLISSWYLDTFDFGKLQEVVGRDLPDLKRRLFLLSLPNITSSIIDKKKEAMMDEIGKVAVLSAASGPIPGLSINCDIPLLVTNLSSYRTDLGLDNDSLGRLAKSVGKRMEELKSEVKSQFGVEVRDEVVRKVLIETGKEEENVRRRLAQYLASAAPDIDPTSSNIITCIVLETAVQEMVEDSKRVLRKGFQ